jgi:hypothetical protein
VTDGFGVDDNNDLPAVLAEPAFGEEQLRHISRELPLLTVLAWPDVGEDLDADRLCGFRIPIQLQCTKRRGMRIRELNA